ncbi:hypothetical protein E4T56_gene10517 [Termitomyces sp. T112]|nr:hypothetical protein E4T56_gene10517 [Termitomyces sp. T112]
MTILPASPTSTPPCPHLSSEILTLIFFPIAPKFLLDCSLSAGRDSPWSKSVETALSISSVCKSWHLAEIPFLYEDVVLRNLGQVPKFLLTIQKAPYKYQDHNLGASFSEYVQNIIDRYTSLKRLGLLPRVGLPPNVALPTLNTKITRLPLNGYTITILFHMEESVLEVLRSLSIFPGHSFIHILSRRSPPSEPRGFPHIQRGKNVLLTQEWCSRLYRVLVSNGLYIRVASPHPCASARYLSS